MVTVTSWGSHTEVSETAVRERFRSEGLSPSSWSNGPGDRYAVHSHAYHKVLYCLRGSITFTVEGEDMTLRPGDRLEIPPGTNHSAVVGPDGVACMEGSR